MASDNPHEAPKRRWGGLRRRRRWVAVLLLIGMGIAWKIFVRPEVEFVGFLEKDGQRVAEFRIKEPFFARRHYEQFVQIRASSAEEIQLAAWSHAEPDLLPLTRTDGRELSFTIETPVSPATAPNFEVGVSYTDAVPSMLRKIPVQWLPESITSGKTKVIWSDTITP